MNPSPHGTESEASAVSPGRFGTFAGVFTPSILTILGVVMYLRFGWIVGNAGLLGTLAIVVISHVITLATGLSISTVATNRTVGAGGAYYIISRSLGAPVGAAVGVPLFMGQALSVSFYAVGFTESLLWLFPALPARIFTTVLAIGLTLLSLKSAEAAIKAQFGVMVMIGLSLVSFYAGAGSSPPVTPVMDEAPGGASFAAVFAVFFPAVTGIMAGVGMSGDLRDPRHSLPRGTLLAILAGFVIYATFPFVLAYNAPRDALLTNHRIVWDIARVPSLIYVGVWGATLSSAIGSLLTAPRTLQALANDGLVPRSLGRGSGEHAEPRVATVVTFAIAVAGIWFGNLDSIANTLTMFFLATYGLTNLACGLELWASSPSFRPDFRVPAWVPLGGAVACFYVMSIIDLGAMAVAMVIAGVIYAVTQRRALGTTYGDARHGIWSALVRSALLALRRAPFHPLNWRPHLVIMGGAPGRREHLVRLGSAIVQDRGVVSHFHLIRGDVEELAPRRHELLGEEDPRFAERFPNVFLRVEIVDDIHQGVVSVAQSYGLGSFEANTVMLGWPRKAERAVPYARMMRQLAALDKSLLLVNHKEPIERGALLHVWWGGLQGNGGLMLLLVFLLAAHDAFRTARAEVMVVVETEGERLAAERAIQGVIDSARVRAVPRVLLRDGRSMAELMRQYSASADLAILGLRLPASDAEAGPMFERMNALLEHLPTTILVFSARNFPGEPVLFSD